jgi:hypothetical protein
LLVDAMPAYVRQPGLRVLIVAHPHRQHSVPAIVPAASFYSGASLSVKKEACTAPAGRYCENPFAKSRRDFARPGTMFRNDRPDPRTS